MILDWFWKGMGGSWQFWGGNWWFKVFLKCLCVVVKMRLDRNLCECQWWCLQMSLSSAATGGRRWEKLEGLDGNVTSAWFSFTTLFVNVFPNNNVFNFAFVIPVPLLTYKSMPGCRLCSRNKENGANGQTHCGGHSGLAHQSVIISISLPSVAPSPVACLAFICSCFSNQPGWQSESVAGSQPLAQERSVQKDKSATDKKPHPVSRVLVTSGFNVSPHRGEHRFLLFLLIMDNYLFITLCCISPISSDGDPCLL